jgi:polar amino acid transport system substrate-binding protein
MKRSLFAAAFCILIATLWQLAAAMAQEAQPATPAGIGQPELNVAVRVIPPFVVFDGDRYSGFSIDLWQAVANDMGWKFRLTRKESVMDLIGAVQKKEVDLGIAAISITSKREELIDFSQPMFDSGLQIMVRSSASAASPMRSMWNFLTSPGFKELLVVLGLLIFLPLPIIWLLERPKGSQFVHSETRVGAVFKSIWWTATTLIGQGTDTPISLGGKILAITWMFVGLVFVSYFTGNITAALTVQRLESGINSPNDLFGRQVVTVKGTTAAQFLQTLGIPATEVADVPAAFAAIQSKSAEAMVYDAPIMLYFAANLGKGQVEMAGPVFKPESYGIAFPLDSPLRENVNRALLRIKESGRYTEIFDRWFGQRS